MDREAVKWTAVVISAGSTVVGWGKTGAEGG